MSAKVILVLCVQALFIQTAFSSCLGRGAIATPTLIAPGCAGNGCAGNGLIENCCDGYWANNGLIYDGIVGNCLIGNGLAASETIPTSGGGLTVFSASPIAPTGLSVVSENVFDGTLNVACELPFLSVVVLEGVVPSGGTGDVSHSCGNGVTAIETIAPSAAAYGAAGAFGLGAGCGTGAAAIAPTALGLIYGDRCCGCGAY